MNLATAAAFAVTTAEPDGLDRAAAELAERAQPFARMPPRDKAALLREVIARTAGAASEIVTIACRAAGIDPTSAKAGGAWLAGPVALLAGARSLAAALDELAVDG